MGNFKLGLFSEEELDAVVKKKKRKNLKQQKLQDLTKYLL